MTDKRTYLVTVTRTYSRTIQVAVKAEDDFEAHSKVWEAIESDGLPELDHADLECDGDRVSVDYPLGADESVPAGVVELER